MHVRSEKQHDIIFLKGRRLPNEINYLSLVFYDFHNLSQIVNFMRKKCGHVSFFSFSACAFYSILLLSD